MNQLQCPKYVAITCLTTTCSISEQYRDHHRRSYPAADVADTMHLFSLYGISDPVAEAHLHPPSAYPFKKSSSMRLSEKAEFEGE